jgi:hypothetical protein
MTSLLVERGGACTAPNPSHVAAIAIDRLASANYSSFFELVKRLPESPAMRRASGRAVGPERELFCGCDFRGIPDVNCCVLAGIFLEFHIRVEAGCPTHTGYRPQPNGGLLSFPVTNLQIPFRN